MQVTNHLHGEHLGERRSEQQRDAEFSAFDSLLFLEAGHGIVVNGMRDLWQSVPADCSVFFTKYSNESTT